MSEPNTAAEDLIAGLSECEVLLEDDSPATKIVQMQFVAYKPLLRVSGESLAAMTDAGREGVVGMLKSFAHRNGDIVHEGRDGVVVERVEQWTEQVEVPADWQPVRFTWSETP